MSEQEYCIICPNCGCSTQPYDDSEVRALSGRYALCHCGCKFPFEFIPLPVIQLEAMAPNPCAKWGGPAEVAD